MTDISAFLGAEMEMRSGVLRLRPTLSSSTVCSASELPEDTLEEYCPKSAPAEDDRLEQHCSSIEIFSDLLAKSAPPTVASDMFGAGKLGQADESKLIDFPRDADEATMLMPTGSSPLHDRLQRRNQRRMSLKERFLSGGSEHSLGFCSSDCAFCSGPNSRSSSKRTSEAATPSTSAASSRRTSEEVA